MFTRRASSLTRLYWEAITNICQKIREPRRCTCCGERARRERLWFMWEARMQGMLKPGCLSTYHRAFNCPSDRAYPAPETYAVYPLLKDYPEKAAVFDVFKEFSYEVSPKGYRRPESYKQAVKEARSYEKKLIQACKDLLGDGCLNKVGGTDEKVSGLRTSLETWVIGAKPGQELLV